MKTQVLSRIVWLLFLMAGWTTVQAQEQAEVPGDNFSLEGALTLFKKSSSPEEFERMLNDPKSKVNNLDLNGDGYIDYIRVIDRYQGNVHVFTLQDVVSENQSQDVAVITLEKQANGKAVLQIIGDEDIYGVETIIEPTREVRTYGGAMTTHVVVNVWSWPFVQYVYGPYYSVWTSPWGWGYRPYWWHPWRPVAYYEYYPYWRPYQPYYRVCYTHRVVYAEHLYRPHRTTSIIVYNRYNTRITHYRSARIESNGRYRSSNDRINGRQASPTVRYTSNGRISTGQRTNASRSSTAIRTGSSNTGSNGRVSSEPSNPTQRASSGRQVQRLRENPSGSSNGRVAEAQGHNRASESRRSTSTPQRVQGSSQRQSGSSIDGRLSTAPGTERTYSRPSRDNQRSYAPRDNQRSSGSSINGRSASPGGERSFSRPSESSHRSYSTPNVQRSSGSSNVQRSSGSSSGRSSSPRSGSSAQYRGRH